MAFKPNADFCLASTASNRWFSMFIPSRVLAEDGDGKTNSLQIGQRAILSSEACKRLLLVGESLYNALQQAPEAFLDPATRDLTRQKLAQAALHVLLDRIPAEPHVGRPPVPRAQIIGMAMNLIDERFEDHLTVQQISSSIGVSERTLRNTFEEYFGMSPVHYLKLRTLHRARSQLKAADPSSSTVTQIAVRLGIWEFGRFARDYRILFGERPSETLHK
jgi:AraC-like DNA-binding protein